MATVGYACLVVGLLTALYAAGSSIYGVRSGQRQFVVSSRYAFYCLAGLMIFAAVILESAYVRNDFSYSLVAQNSSTDTPTFYKLTAMWSSQAGSLLLWGAGALDLLEHRAPHDPPRPPRGGALRHRGARR